MSMSPRPEDRDAVAAIVALGSEAQCSARSKQSGKRCSRRPIPGGTVCHIHGGGAPQVKAAAAERLAQARDDALSVLQARILAEGAEWDPRILLEAVTKLTDKAALLSGEATSRTETRKVDGEARERLEAVVEDLAGRAKRRAEGA